MAKYAKISVAFLALGLSLLAKERRLENRSGLWDVRVLTRIGFIDSSGRMVIFSQADCFINGLAHVSLLGREGYMDRQGRMVWEPGR